MIVIKLTGGLGNQMFQYAIGRSLSLRLNRRLSFDMTEFHSPVDTTRGYMLDYFPLNLIPCEPSLLSQFRSLAPWLKKNSFQMLYKSIFLKSLTYYREKSHRYDPEVFSSKDNTYFDGYWASELYFIDIAKIIRKDFTFSSKPDLKNTQLIKKIRQTNSVAVHIRRTDFVTNKNARKFNGFIGLSYYKRAFEVIQLKTVKPYFFIFTDDQKWARSHLVIPKTSEIVIQNLGVQDHEDMRLMSLCKHYIIANSTFSWWGAWLNKSPQKLVIAPQKWFREKSVDTRDIVPKSWLRI